MLRLPAELRLSSGINNLGAALAFQIGEAKVGDAFGEGLSKDILSIGAHAALGCAGSAASWNGCAGGAIGAAASAAFTPDFIKGIDPSGAPLNEGQLAALSMLSSLIGAGLSGAAGADANAGAFWAQNQALNNEAGSPEHIADAVKGGVVSSITALIYTLMPAMPGNPVMQAARNQFIDLMNAEAKRKMSEPPEQLIAEGIANGWTAVGGAGGGRPPMNNPGTVLVNGTRGAGSASGMGMPGYVPDNVMLSHDGGGDTSGDGSSERGSATNTVPDGTNVGWTNTTIGRSIPNSAIDLTRGQFEKSLLNSGFTAPPKGGVNEVTVYTKGNIQYAVRNNASSTGGPSVDYRVNGNLVSKLRLNGH
ncbi:tRNA nuclease CdiA-2 [Pandoraea captiosa]|uniref:tRNA nuclease CdiA-2 n=2 Tax=Pandoraea captiosa TaxID=2508302 RepID=A0A5E5AI98_9BURK|nr:tRNA nuclease CdiA-2 [Pandoraea captiosa]